MDASGGNVIQLELKYCERCGGLWLRRKGTDHNYCAPCTAATAECPARRRLPTRPRLPVKREPAMHGQLKVLHVMQREGREA